MKTNEEYLLLEQQLAAKDALLRQSRESFSYLAHCIRNRPVLQGLIQKSILAIDKELGNGQ
jgi:hypothetical protein